MEGLVLQTLSSAIIPDLKINSERLRADFEELAQFGASPGGGINRLALSPEDLQARSWFANRIEEAGLEVNDDDAGNLGGVLPSPDENARTLLLGSHLDSVPEGGRFDGSVGVLAGLECLRVIQEAGVELPVHLEAIDFTDDEGCWRSLFGSRALTGRLTPEDVNDAGSDNAPFRAALTRAGIIPREVFNAQRPSDTLAGYLEVHIEQGSRLERANTEIGVVTGIVGRTTYDLVFQGQAGHSGTTDMYRRKDALRGASQFIVRAHDLVRERYGDGVFNCGNIAVKPGAFNIIPSEAHLTFEFRHVNEGLMAEMERALISAARESAAANGLTVSTEVVAQMPAVSMSGKVIQTVEQACDDLGLNHMRLVSYSGHDAQMLSLYTPSAMIFIPSADGISHNPREFTRWEDVVNGANVLLRTALRLALKS
jgi:hydantoinase/carbamoylase family amidase